MIDYHVMKMTDEELEQLALRLGGQALVDRIHEEAAGHAEVYPMIDDTELPDRAAAYRTVWRLRVADARRKEGDGGMAGRAGAVSEG